MPKRTQYRSLIHWGTSTWTYPEWQGIAYHKPRFLGGFRMAALPGMHIKALCDE